MLKNSTSYITYFCKYATPTLETLYCTAQRYIIASVCSVLESKWFPQFWQDKQSKNFSTLLLLQRPSSLVQGPPRLGFS